MNLVIFTEDDYLSSNVISITGRRFEHITKVIKPDIGKILKVGLLNGKTGNGLVKSISDTSVEIETELLDEPRSPLDMIIVMAMPRPKVFKRILQFSASVGIKELHVIRTFRVDKSYFQSPYLNQKNIDRNLILGLEQGCLTRMPRVHIHKLFKPFVEDKLPDIADGYYKIAAHPGHDSNEISGKKICVAIGPEGGFIDFEIELLKKAGFTQHTFCRQIISVENYIPMFVGRYM